MSRLSICKPFYKLLSLTAVKLCVEQRSYDRKCTNASLAACVIQSSLWCRLSWILPKKSNYPRDHCVLCFYLLRGALARTLTISQKQVKSWRGKCVESISTLRLQSLGEKKTQKNWYVGTYVECQAIFGLPCSLIFPPKIVFPFTDHSYTLECEFIQLHLLCQFCLMPVRVLCFPCSGLV